MSGFKWAYGSDANVKEPFEGLKENGWQEGDVPTASNFNWLFQEIGEDIQAKAIYLEQKLTELRAQLFELGQKHQQLTDALNTAVANSNQNTIDCEHYKRAISACIHQLNGKEGEKLGLDTGVNNDYPFLPKP